MEFKSWYERLKFALIDWSGFEYDDDYNASHWGSCAVGERDSKMLKLLNDEMHYKEAEQIINPKVIELGNKFSIAIQKNQKRRALSLYLKIRMIPKNSFYRTSAKEIADYIEFTKSRVCKIGLDRCLY